MAAYREYSRRMYDVLEDMFETQGEKIETVAEWMADSIAAGGVVHLFGSGHSHLVAEEVFHRAGSLMALNPMLDVNLTFLGSVNATLLERTAGYAKVVMGSHDIREGEIVIVISNSGVNPVPIEAVLEARARGAKTVAITSDRHYTDAPSRHESGKRLAEIADITLDTCVPWGDAIVNLLGVEQPVGGISSVAGLALITSIVVETTQRLLDKGIDPPVIPTMNLPGGDEKIEGLIETYGHRLPLLKNA
ncbi:MAG: SIS domain-containing protein [Thermomicrobiales bacterium]|nr:SIS domain-containing protein [Thermomicrobiales bacterium]MCO5219418.1 SIS domain-containing protein [Thermomicrobiales bacterium]MCO5225192.1 SIS domain-containing protein [Thermomicrobiales bacterium]MCO5227014.1 SIS domain-containing protein [Thermomicrobiales bacterium]